MPVQADCVQFLRWGLDWERDAGETSMPWLEGLTSGPALRKGALHYETAGVVQFQLRRLYTTVPSASQEAFGSVPVGSKDDWSRPKHSQHRERHRKQLCGEPLHENQWERLHMALDPCSHLPAYALFGQQGVLWSWVGGWGQQTHWGTNRYVLFVSLKSLKIKFHIKYFNPNLKIFMTNWHKYVTLMGWFFELWCQKRDWCLDGMEYFYGGSDIIRTMKTWKLDSQY